MSSDLLSAKKSYRNIQIENQNCLLMTGLRSGHLDSSRWDDPNKFEPKRFLDNEGQLDLRRDHSVPFGAGEYFV